MNAYVQESRKLIDFIKKSPSCFHAVAAIAEELNAAGFTALKENQCWELQAGGKYYVTRNGSSVIAFQLPQGVPGGFQLICSHTDSPTFKVKVCPEMEVEKKYKKLNVEMYGGTICSPWFDRPLSVAGRVIVKTEDGIRPVLVNVERDLLMIPNIAIHMGRDINDGYKYNIQKDMCPVFSEADSEAAFLDVVAEAAGLDAEQILGTDLFLYNRQNGTIWGADEAFVASPRLDDLQCAYASLQGFLEAVPGGNAAVYCAFDNEETGSVSRQGAASTFLRETLRRITLALGMTEEAHMSLLAGSFMISSDNAHAVHPNHTDKADPVNRPQMNKGIVIKYNANQKYTTDAISTAVFRTICEKAEVPCQVFTNRSDMAGGSTLGNISNTQVSLRSVDIGLPQLAMHSPYETAGVKDTLYFKKASKEFYSTTLKLDEELMQVF